MLQKTFGIYSEELAGCDLFIETGSDHIACWCKETVTKAVKAFELFSFTVADGEDLEKIVSEVRSQSRLLTTHFEKAHCIWGYDKCICVPELFYSADMAAAMIGAMFGEINDTMLYTGTVNGIVTIAVSPVAAIALYQRSFGQLTHTHKYLQLIKGQTNNGMESKIYLVFYPTHCILSAYKNGVFQCIKSYAYKAPEDILYYVLNVCDALEMAISDTQVIASGLIDTASPLYIVLNTYIDHLSFVVADKALYAAEDLHTHPLHYFASFCQYDT